MWACYKGKEDTVVALVNRGADINAYGIHHVTALMWSTGRGHTNIAKFLVSKGARVTMRDKVRWINFSLFLHFSFSAGSE